MLLRIEVFATDQFLTLQHLLREYIYKECKCSVWPYTSVHTDVDLSRVMRKWVFGHVRTV